MAGLCARGVSFGVLGPPYRPSSQPACSVWMCLLPPRPARLQSCLTWGPVEVGDTQAESARGPLDSSQHVLQAVHLPASCRAHPGPQTSKYRKRLLLDPKPLKEEESQEGGDESCTQGKRKLRLTPKCPPRPWGSISNGDWGGGRNSVLGNGWTGQDEVGGVGSQH